MALLRERVLERLAVDRCEPLREVRLHLLRNRVAPVTFGDDHNPFVRRPGDAGGDQRGDDHGDEEEGLEEFSAIRIRGLAAQSFERGVSPEDRNTPCIIAISRNNGTAPKSSDTRALTRASITNARDFAARLASPGGDDDGQCDTRT